METQNGRHTPGYTHPESSNGRPRAGHGADGTPRPEPGVQQSPPLSSSPEPFHILETTANGRRVIAPCGELDLATAAELKERLAGSSDTVLDLSQLSFIDSSGNLGISIGKRAAF